MLGLDAVLHVSRIKFEFWPTQINLGLPIFKPAELKLQNAVRIYQFFFKTMQLVWLKFEVRCLLMHCRFKLTLVLWRTASESGLKVPWLLDVSCYRLYSHTLLHRSIWSIKCYFGFSYLTRYVTAITNRRRRSKGRYPDSLFQAFR